MNTTARWRILGASLGALATLAFLGWTATWRDAFTFPLLYPQIMLILLVALFAAAAAQVLANARQGLVKPLETAPGAVPRPTSMVLASMALIVGYVVSWNQLGHLPATLIFIPALLLLLGERRPVLVAALALATAAVIYPVFYRLLRVPLPRGNLFESWFWY